MIAFAMRLVLVLVATAACGGGGTQGPRTPAGPVAPVTTAAPAAGPPAKPAPVVTAEAFCEHYIKLTSKCERMAGAKLDPNTCVADIRTVLASPQEGEQMKRFGACVIEHDDCDDVFRCLAGALPDTTAAGTLRACDDHSRQMFEHAVGIPKAEWDHRNGAGVAKFHDARSTKDDPVETCGVPAATTWLTSLRCDDGSQPIKDVSDAENARTGNLGGGGRCRSFIDHSVVPCPERSYEIFVDAYVCPLAP
jgi:hypothetical protein